MENSPNAIAIFTVKAVDNGKRYKYKILAKNLHFEKMIGFTEIKSSKKSPASRKHYKIELPFFDKLKKVASTGKPIIFESIYPENNKTYEIKAFSLNKGHVAAVYTDITERWHAERALKNSEILYKITIDSINDLVHIVDSNLRFTFVNKTFEKWCDKFQPATRIEGKTIFDAFPFLAETVRDEYKKVFETGKALHTEDKSIFDGSEIITETDKIPIFDGDTVTNVLTIVKDISSRKLTEQALNDSEARFKELFNSVIEGIGLVDENEVIQICNPAFVSILEEKNSFDIIGKTILDYVPDEQKEILFSQTKLRMENKTSQYELNILTAKKNIKNVLISASPRFDKNGKYMGALGTIIDITSRKQAETALQKNEKFLQNIFDSIQDGISVLGPDLEIIHSNKTMETWFPHQLPLKGKKCFEAYHGIDQPCAICPTIRAIQYGTLQSGTIPVIGPDRSRIWLEVYAHPLLDNNGALTGVIEFVRDISKKKQTEDEREKLIFELQEALTNIKTLSGLLPMCASCKKIRDDQGYWNQVETYFSDHSDLTFSHSFCPECARKLYPDIYDDIVKSNSSK